MGDNPFVSIGAIRDADHFYGRTAELRRIYDYLKVDNPQCCQIVGDDKSGKTSLLNYLDDPAVRKAQGLDTEQHIFIYFSFQSNPLISQQDFWRKILQKISRQITESRMKSQVDQLLTQEVLNLPDDIYGLFSLFTKEGYQVFLLIDEFQIVVQNPSLLDKVFFSNLRYINTHYNVAYIVATTASVGSLIPEIFGSPFPNSFATIYLNLFTEQETRDFILQVKRPVSPSLEAEWEFILRLAGRHPYLTQIVCYWVFDVLTQKGGLTEDDYAYIREQSYDEAVNFFQGGLWPKLASDRARKVLIDLAWGREVDPIVNRDVIRPLSRYQQYIVPQDSGWEIFCELFYRFLREQNTDSPVAERASFRVKPRPDLEYDDFEIDINLPTPNNEYLVRVFHSGAGEGSFYSRIDLGALQESLDGIRERNTDLRFLKTFGSELMKALISSDVQRRYDTAFGVIVEGQRGLRIRLRVDPPELACLPWEFLYDPDSGRWLASSTAITFSRYVEAPLSQPKTKLELPLNILMILSSPADAKKHNLAELDLNIERDMVNDATRDMIDLGLVTVDTLPKATVSALREKLSSSRKRYHVLHFCGHGLFADEDLDQFSFQVPLNRDTGYLILQNEKGLSRPVHQETLVELTKDKGIGLVVISACRSATSSPTERLSGLATALARAGIPAVVAMQYEVLDDVARLFAKVFYAALADGWPVDVCMAEARRAIAIDYDHANRDWATPVLYMRSKDGMIFDINIA